MRTLSLLFLILIVSAQAPLHASWQRFGTAPVAAVDFFNAHQGLLSLKDPTHAIQRVDDSILTGVFQAPNAVTGIIIQDSLNAWATIKNNGLFLGSKHWSSWTNTTAQKDLTLIAATPSRVFLYSDSQLYYTVDGTQLKMATGIPKGDSITAIDHLSDAIVLACSYSTLYRSTDAGVTWHVVQSGLRFCTTIFADAMHNIAYAGGDTIQRSTDGGMTWLSQTPPPPFSSWLKLSGFVTGSHDCSGVLFISNNPFLGRDYDNIRSADQGQTFEDVGITPPLTRGVLVRGWSFDRGSLFWWWDTTGFLASSRDGLNGEITDSIKNFVAVQADSLVDTVCGSLASAKKYTVDVHIATALCVGARIDSISVIAATGKIVKTFAAHTLFGDGMTVTLNYTPTAAGVDAAVLRLWFHGIEWGLREHLDFPLIATSSTLPPVLAPLSNLDFGTVSLVSPKTLTFQISNTGCSPLRVDSVVSTNPNLFAVHVVPTMPANIQSGNDLAVSVTFAPQMRGDALESIEIGTNAGHRFISAQGVGSTNADVESERSLDRRFSLYPNPASSIVGLRGGDVLGAPVVIYDLLGREIMSVLPQQNTFDVSLLSDGSYLVRVGSSIARLIVARP